MLNTDVNYAVIGKKSSTKEAGFIYIDRGCSDYSFSNEPSIVVSQTPSPKALHYSISPCKDIIKFIQENFSSQVFDLKILCIETTYDWESIQITTKIYEVMDNNELIELGKECE